MTAHQLLEALPGIIIAGILLITVVPALLMVWLRS